LKNRASSFAIAGEAVLLGVDGVGEKPGSSGHATGQGGYRGQGSFVAAEIRHKKHIHTHNSPCLLGKFWHPYGNQRF